MGKDGRRSKEVDWPWQLGAAILRAEDSDVVKSGIRTDTRNVIGAYYGYSKSMIEKEEKRAMKNLRGYFGRHPESEEDFMELLRLLDNKRGFYRKAHTKKIYGLQNADS